MRLLLIWQPYCRTCLSTVVKIFFCFALERRRDFETEVHSRLKRRLPQKRTGTTSGRVGLRVNVCSGRRAMEAMLYVELAVVCVLLVLRALIGGLLKVLRLQLLILLP